MPQLYSVITVPECTFAELTVQAWSALKLTYLDAALERRAFALEPKTSLRIRGAVLQDVTRYGVAVTRYLRPAYVPCVPAFIALMMRLDAPGTFVHLLDDNDLITCSTGDRGAPAFFRKRACRQLYVDDFQGGMSAGTKLVMFEPVP